MIREVYFLLVWTLTLLIYLLRRFRLIHLTPQQIKIVTLTAEGKNTKRIAIILKIAEKTVYSQKARIYQQTGLNELTDWVHFAFLKGWARCKTWEELGISPTDESEPGLYEEKKGDIVRKQPL